MLQITIQNICLQVWFILLGDMDDRYKLEYILKF